MTFFAVLLAATATLAEIPVARVADDARAIDRVAAASKRDLPRDLLKRILDEDIDLLRGRHSDGTFDYASYERMEAGRSSSAFSVEEKRNDATSRLEIRGSYVYRLLIELPSRRMLVTKNRRVYIERADLEYVPEKGGSARTQSVKIAAWLDPGGSRSVDFDEIARQATVRVFARVENESGYGNVVLTLVQARIFDDPTSPYADAVSSAKAILRAIDHDDVASMRAMAQRMANDLQPKTAAAEGGGPPKTVEVIAQRQDPELLKELQAIEDLLTGNETERRQGLDRLHQLLRKLRSTPQ